MQNIGTYFVVDFDRCIGNIDASFNLLNEVAHELMIVNKELFISMRKQAESEGKPFSAIEQLKKKYPSTNLDIIEKMYLKKASLLSSELLEPGARDFLDYLHFNKINFCIMSFGDERWQKVKIKGAGITKTPVIIVKRIDKSSHIREWLNPKSGKFLIPKKYFLDNKSKVASEIVLIDDKVKAFENLPLNVRGYIVLGSSSTQTKLQIDGLPSSIKKVDLINEIIDQEFL